MKYLAFLMIFLLSNFAILAQDEDIPTVEYGDEVRGTVLASTGEAEFQFEGSAGDIIVIEASVGTNDILSGLMPEIQLLNDRGRIVAETSSIFDFETSLDSMDFTNASLTVEVPADGIYTILVTSNEFSMLQSDARFTLRLIEPVILVSGESVTDTVSSDFPAYYAVVSSERFTIEYEHLSGSFFPSVNVGQITDGSVELTGAMYGTELVDGSLSFVPGRNTLYLVTVLASALDFDTIFASSEADISITFSN